VSVQDHPTGMSVAMQAENPPGAMVAEVASGSAAEKAGLQRGDIIIAVDGRPIVSAGQLRARVGLIPVGQNIELDVLRDGNRVKLNARIVTVTSPAGRSSAKAALTETTYSSCASVLTNGVRHAT
jgi:S1-C subfamily serine protease